MSTEYFDFGFTAVDENELETVRLAQETTTQLEQQLTEVDNKAKALYDAITPLLSSLKTNSEKDYIYWPNRYDKIEEFQAKLAAIMYS